MSGFQLRHGEAVAVGIALDSIYAVKTGELDVGALKRILALLRNLGLPIFTPELRDADTLLRGLDEFREHLGGDLCVTFPRGIGTGHEINAIDHALMRVAIGELEVEAHTTNLP